MVTPLARESSFGRSIGRVGEHDAVARRHISLPTNRNRMRMYAGERNVAAFRINMHNLNDATSMRVSEGTRKKRSERRVVGGKGRKECLKEALGRKGGGRGGERKDILFGAILVIATRVLLLLATQ